MKKANLNPSGRPTNSNQMISVSKPKKVKKSGCGCGKKNKRV
ncbi:hypothetical protein [Metabacillus niabensis]|nr:hypothetical protein [Metabacillus niabensis]